MPTRTEQQMHLHGANMFYSIYYRGLLESKETYYSVKRDLLQCTGVYLLQKATVYTVAFHSK
jgi:hypothetical protein